MTLSIAAFRNKQSKPAETTEKSTQKGPPVLPGAGPLQAPVQVPRLGRGWDWDTFKKVVVGIQQWFI